MDEAVGESITVAEVAIEDVADVVEEEDVVGEQEVLELECGEKIPISFSGKILMPSQHLKTHGVVFAP